jgi:hypothetical protein
MEHGFHPFHELFEQLGLGVGILASLPVAPGALIKRAMQPLSLFRNSITPLVGFTGSGLVVWMDSEVIPCAQFQPAIVLFLAKIAEAVAGEKEQA